ncbi:putative ribonuclease H-like domain-containing protein [Tanacetum coccineum]|uniref:Ribonuclease H-like domain-containing protein n=1 Tax=Tanacetum coccineum TaxID=301880 RepID=A0ABQ5F9W2_9ASTR
MNQLGDQEAQILAYSQAVKKLEAQLVTFQKQQLSLNEKLTFQANEIYEKDEKLKRYRRIGMKAVKEKEQLQKTGPSENLKLVSQMTISFEHLLLEVTKKVVSELHEVEPSCAKHIKTPRQPLKDKEIQKVNRKNWNDMMERELGKYGLMQTGTNINSVRPRVNAVSPKVNTVRSRQPVPHKTSNSVSPKRPQMNQINQRRDFSTSHSSVRRPFAKTTAQMSHSNAVMGSWGSAVKTSASYNWRNSRPNFHYNSGPTFNRTVNAKGPQGRPKPAKAWHKVLFTETECLVVSPDFKMPDENQILLKVPRQHNMYSFDMKTPAPAKDYTCLIAKATSDESKLWHRRLGHINFKNLNKLVKGNLVRGLPSKVFRNDHTCVACHKGKQHKASCKAKLERTITEPLHTLHMDLFGPTSVKSINHASYCLVITDDCTRFSWVFFLATKDETSGILQNFIRQIENQLNHRVKIIRSDNGTEFKNRDMLEFCGNKGIKQEYSNARTPQQNGVAERMNRTLIEAARTMLADSLLPTTFWAEAVSIACYIFNRNQTNPHAVTSEVTNSAGTLQTPNVNISEEEDEAEELIVVPTTVKHTAAKNEAYSTGILEDTPEILAFRRELDELAQKHLREVPKNKATSTNSVNSGSGSANTQPVDDDSDMPELIIFNKPQKGIFDEASYDDEGVVYDFNNLPTEVAVSPIPTLRIHNIHPQSQILGDPKSSVQTRSRVQQTSGAHALEEPKKISKALKDDSWVEAMQEELNKQDERGVVVRNKARLVAQGHRQKEDTLSVLGKFDGKCDEGFLVGYSLNSKAFRVYNLVTKKVEVNLHVKFLEEKPNVKGVGYRWMFDIDYLTDSMNYIPVSLENQTNPHAGTSEVTNSAGTLQTPNANASEEEDEAEELIIVPTAVRQVGPRKSSTNSKAEEFLTELQNLKTQEKEAYSTGISEDTPEILAFRRELDELAQKHLREVPKNKATNTTSVNSGSGPVNTQHADQDDSDMPELIIFNRPQKGIFDEASYDDEGMVHDFKNLPTEVAVSPIPTLMIHNIHPQSQILGDPKSSMQTRNKVQQHSGAHALVRRCYSGPLLPAMLPVVAVDQSAGQAYQAVDQPSSYAPLPSSSHPLVLSETTESEPIPVTNPTPHPTSPSLDPDSEPIEYTFEQPSPEHQPLSPRQETEVPQSQEPTHSHVAEERTMSVDDLL